MAAKKHILLGVTGSIAAYKACEIIRCLQRQGMDVAVVMTEEAKQFVTPLTFASLSQNRVYTDMFLKDFNDWDVEHVSLAEKADLLLVAPATANIIGKLSAGMADDFLSCVAMATKAPVVLAPAMNEGMYTNKIVQENIKKLKGHGVHVVSPVKGRLACGSVGEGHLADVEVIVKKVCALLKNK
jgi:phosphopantothenoylcysteine decarboxylase/phosphopantothenate--cysteine ligase